MTYTVSGPGHSLPAQHRDPRSKPLFPWLRVTLAVVFTVALFAVVAVPLILGNLQNQMHEAVIDTSNLGAQKVLAAGPDPFVGKPVNILVIGVDSRYGDNADVGAGDTDEFETILSDTNMIVHISEDRQSATIVSIPRDLIVDIPSCKLGDGSYSYPMTAQFNWAFSTGAVTDDIAGGVACTEATTEELTGLTIDGFVLIDFSGFEKLVDSLGGLEVCPDEDMRDEVTGLDIKAGCQTLPGYVALKFVRARKGIDDGSDIYRMGRQQQAVGSMIKDVLQSNTLADIPRLYAFTKEMLEIVGVSQSFASMNADVGLMNSLRKIPHENIRFLTVPWIPAPSDPNRLIEAEPLASQLWESLRQDAPLPEGIEYKNMDNEFFIMGADGQPVAEQNPNAEETGDEE